MAVNNSLPFSMKWAQNKGKAGGMNLPKAYTEIIDNDIDSQGEIGYSYAKTFYDPTAKKAYFMLWSGGEGLSELPHLFGLGVTTPKKNSNMIGNFNHGHTAAVAYLNPSVYQALSKTDTSVASLLTFNVQTWDAAVSRIGVSEDSNDYRQVNVDEYMVVTNELESIVATLKKINKSVRDDSMNTDLKSICDNVKGSYMLHLFTFDWEHQLCQNFSIDAEIGGIDESDKGFFPSLSLHYEGYLRNGYRICYEKNGKTPKNKLLVADSSTTISPLVSVNTFPKISFDCTLYKGQYDGKDETYLSLYMTCSGHEYNYYITDIPSDGRKKSQILTKVLPRWADYTQVGEFTFDLNCPSEDAFKVHQKKLGTDLSSREDARGIYVQYRARNLGKPFWSTDLFGSARNSGFVGAALKTDSKIFAKDFLGLQSNKHNSDLNDAHPVIKTFLQTTMKAIISNFTHYDNKDTCKTGILSWNSQRVYDILTNTTPKQKTKAKEKPAPVIDDSPPANVLGFMGARKRTPPPNEIVVTETEVEAVASESETVTVEPDTLITENTPIIAEEVVVEPDTLVTENTPIIAEEVVVELVAPAVTTPIEHTRTDTVLTVVEQVTTENTPRVVVPSPVHSKSAPARKNTFSVDVSHLSEESYWEFIVEYKSMCSRFRIQ